MGQKILGNYYMIDLYTQYIDDWQSSLEITGSFLKGLRQGWILGYSFIRYSGDRPLAHITVRFNFVDENDGKQKTEKIIDELIRRRLVVEKGEWTAFQDLPSVTNAAETATKCAFVFKNWMNQNPKLYRYYDSSTLNRGRFMARFLVLLLQQLGFHTHLEEYPLSPDFIELLRNGAAYCAEEVRSDFNKELDMVFMERMIHLFLNCVHVKYDEEFFIYREIRHWEWFGGLLEKRDLRVSI